LDAAGSKRRCLASACVRTEGCASSSYEDALAWLRQAKSEAAALEGFVRGLVLTRPG
jgi:hypothetical protein